MYRLCYQKHGKRNLLFETSSKSEMLKEVFNHRGKKLWVEVYKDDLLKIARFFDCIMPDKVDELLSNF